MFLELVLAVIIGCVLGVITGVTPGVHMNLVAAMVTGVAVVEQMATPLVLGVALAAMAVTHTFLDVIPAFFLSVPDADMALSALPAYEYVKEGRVHEAVMLALIGSLGGLLITVMFVPLLLVSVERVYDMIAPYIGVFLVQASVFLLWKERGSRVLAVVLFVLSGVLGMVVLGLPVRQVLLPLFSGLFGLPLLLLNMNKRVVIPAQRVSFPTMRLWDSVKAIGNAVVSGAVFCLLPGLGPSQAAVLGSQVVKTSKAGLLILLGGINTVNMVVSFVTLYTIQKARNGPVVAIAELLSDVSLEVLWVLVAASLVAACLATVLTMIVSRVFAKVMSLVEYRVVVRCVLVFLVALVGLLSGWVGLVILVTAACLGTIPNVKDVHRSHLMGCLLVPVMLFFLV